MTLKFTILGCGSSGGVPRPALGWGVCDPNNPKNRRRRTSFLVERRTRGRRHAGSDRHVAGPARAASRRRGRLGRRRAVHARARRPYPRHRRPARPVHQPPQARAGLARRTRLAHHERPLQLLLHLRARQRISAHGPRAPHGGLQGRSRSRGREASITALPILQDHGDITSLGFRFGSLAYSCDLSGLPPDSVSALEGLDVWIIDALRDKPHPSHLSVSEALDWIESLKPKRAILTNLHTDLDYDELRSRLPSHVEPAYDGLSIELPET